MDTASDLTRGLGLSRLRILVKVVLKHLLAPVGLVLRPRPGLRVLFYHRVNTYPFDQLGPVSREVSVPSPRFEAQMAHLARRGFRSLSLADAEAMISGRVPHDPKAVLITFDDGYADNLTDAAPVLERHGFTAVVFPVLDLMGADNSIWPFSDRPEMGRFMSLDQLKEWLARGHEIGSHTLSHPILTGLDDARLEAELGASRKRLEEALGRPCTTIAYPFGDVDARVAAAAGRAGYALGFTTRSGCNPAGTEPLLIRRTEVSISDSRLIFQLKLRGVFDWLGVRDTGAYRGLMRRLNRLYSTLSGLPRSQSA